MGLGCELIPSIMIPMVVIMVHTKRKQMVSFVTNSCRCSGRQSTIDWLRARQTNAAALMV